MQILNIHSLNFTIKHVKLSEILRIKNIALISSSIAKVIFYAKKLFYWKETFFNNVIFNKFNLLKQDYVK